MTTSKQARDMDVLAARLVPLSAESGAAMPPTEIQLIPAGWVETETRGRFLLDAEAIRAIQDAFSTSGRQLVLDYEHQTLTGEEAPAAGWITQLLDKGEAGLWGAVSWTPRGADYVRNREYRYLSPVVLVRQSDRRAVQLHSVALTNTPEIRHLRPLVAKAACSYPLAAHSAHSHSHEEEPMREQLITLLTMKQDATDEEILAALTARLTPHVPSAVVEALSLQADATVSEAVATIHALKQAQATAPTVAALQAELTALKQQLASREADEAVARALEAGKLTPAQEEWAKAYARRDPAGFEVFIAKAPVVVPPGMVASPMRPPDPHAALDDAQRRVNRLLGVSDESFQRYAV